MRCLSFTVLVGFLFEITFCQISYEKILKNINKKTKAKLSPQCRKELNGINMLTSTYWLMVDSSSRIPSGIAEGNILPMGNYDECLKIDTVEMRFCQSSINMTTELLSKLQTMLTFVDKNIVLNKFLQNPDALTGKFTDLGLYYCVLKSCSAQDLNIIFPAYLRFHESKCFSKDSEPKLDALANTTIVIFVSISLIALLSTIYDIYLKATRQIPIHSSTIAFSLYTNAKKLFHVGNSQQIRCLNGIKFISTVWVVFAHVYMGYIFVPLDNYVQNYERVTSAFNQHLTGGTFSVDTFLVVTGFITITSFQTTMDKGAKFNVPLYYFHRYLRLTPPLAALVLAHVGILNYLGSGPIWHKTDITLVKPCEKYWWSVLLYSQNYLNTENLCVPQSWYLSIDMQLCMISPVILVLMRYRSFWGYICLSVASLISMIASFTIAWLYQLNSQIQANIKEGLQDFMKYYYMPLHTRIAPYLFGIMLGYAIYNLKTTKRKHHLSKALVLCGWMSSFGLVAIIAYLGHMLQIHEYNRLRNSLFMAFMRPAWSIAVCWVIFACVMGYGGLINDFLSCTLFQILSRLSYSIYLIHYPLIMITNFSVKSAVHMTDYTACHKFWGDFMFTLGISIPWTLIFESPIIVLEKPFLKRAADKTDKKSLMA